MPTIATPEKKKTVTATYNRSEEAHYAVLEDGTVIRVKNRPDWNSLIVYRLSDGNNSFARLDAQKGVPVSEERFCRAVEDYFKAIKFPCNLKLK